MTIETKKQTIVEMDIPAKTMHTSYGDMDVAIPRDRNGDYEPQLIKKISEYRNSGHGRKNTFHVCQGNDNRRTLNPA